MPYKNPIMTNTYRSWQSMEARCYNPSSSGFSRYGGRGISVCKRWATFSHFLKDMGLRPLGHVLDRIKITGNYSPSNCRWVTYFQSTENRSITVWLQFPNGRMRVKDASQKYGIAEHLIYRRIAHGWTLEETVLTPPGKQGKKSRKTKLNRSRLLGRCFPK